MPFSTAWTCATAEFTTIRPAWNGAPSQELLVIRCDHHTGQVSFDPLRWGLIPHFCEDRRGVVASLSTRNAKRSASLPTFRDAYRRRRCILPVDGFFEWKAIKGNRPSSLMPSP